MIESRQPRFSKEQVYAFYRSIERWVELANLTAPKYGVSQRARDEWLNWFWKQEPHLAGVVSSAVSIDKNRGWQIVGGKRQVNNYSKVLRNFNPYDFGVNGFPINGDGWRYGIAQQATSYYTTDFGVVTELGRDVEGGRLVALWHVDSTRCELTNSIDKPLKYYPSGEMSETWERDWYMRATSMPSTSENLGGLGYCAVSRCLEAAVEMVAIYQHDQEKLLAKIPKGLLLMRGITEQDWEDAMLANNERLTAKEREYYAGLSILFGDEALDAKLIALSSLPDGFELKTVTDLLMYTYALCFGYDPSEFWPVQFGSLGRGTEAEVQALKATGKGGLDFVLAYQDNLQRELPPTLHFEFEQRNEQGEILEAKVAEQWAKAINEMAKPSSNDYGPTLTNSEKRQLLAQHGLIPDDWTIQEEETVVTDTDSQERERLMDTLEVRRAIAEYPDEDIIRYTWPKEKVDVIYSPEEAQKYFYFVVGNVYRTQDDYERGLRRLARALRRGVIGSFEFVDGIMPLIQRSFRQAWVQGAKDMGFSEEEIEPQDYVPVDKLISAEAMFILGFADWIISMRDQPASYLEPRILQWANRYTEVLNASRAYFGKNKKLLWQVNYLKESCEDCLSLDQQVRRAKFWAENNLHPLSMRLACGPGRRCGCEFQETDKPTSRGRLPRIVGPERSAAKETLVDLDGKEFVLDFEDEDFNWTKFVMTGAVDG